MIVKGWKPMPVILKIIWIILIAIDLLVTANKHGQPRENYNFWATLLGSMLVTSLLYWGGFFG